MSFQVPIVSIKDIMSRKVIAVSPDTPLVEVAQVLARHNFDGVPVVDKDNRLVGILTEYDLISKESTIHLPTFQIILYNLQIFKKDRSRFTKEINSLASLTAKDVMNDDPLTLTENANFEDVVVAFKNHHKVNPIPVIDSNRKVVGIVSRFDVLKPLHVI